MKITFDQNIVNFLPDTDNEVQDLETLWVTIVECMADSKKLVPIGEYIPVKNSKASFVIEYSWVH